MFFMPAWVTNFLFLITCYLAGYQHTRLNRENPILNLQFMVIAGSLIMVLLVALYNRVNPWLSLVFFLLAAGDLFMMIRQHRMLPPNKAFE
jgi:Ca2+/Na+ antiporter